MKTWKIYKDSNEPIKDHVMDYIVPLNEFMPYANDTIKMLYKYTS